MAARLPNVPCLKCGGRHSVRKVCYPCKSPRWEREEDKDIGPGNAADCAEHVLHIFERDYPNDKRPREAIEAARAFARGEIDAAAWAAAWSAADAAASVAARAAASVAARAAAEAAEIKWQREHFDEMFGGIFND